jgi:hypothetical protein
VSFMANRLAEYRAQAEHYRQIANDTLSPIDREMWLELSADWLSMASIYERHRGHLDQSEAKH